MSGKQRSLGAPEQGITRDFPGNDTTVKAPRVLPTSMAAPYCELREGRVFIGHTLGESRWAETSFSISEFRALGPQLRAVFAALKETP